MNRTHRIRHFVRHYLEMLVAMLLGMAVLGLAVVALGGRAQPLRAS